MQKKKKKIEVEKNNDKYGKAFCKLMDNTVYGKTMKNVSYVILSLWWGISSGLSHFLL